MSSSNVLRRPTTKVLLMMRLLRKQVKPQQLQEGQSLLKHLVGKMKQFSVAV